MIKNKYTVVYSHGYEVVQVEAVPFKVKGTSLVKAQRILKELNNANR